MRLGYIIACGFWSDLDRKIEIHGPAPPNENDYYFLIDDQDCILRCFDELQPWDQPLGEIYDLRFNKVCTLPACIHPDFKGLKSSYKSNINWIQGYRDNCVSIVMRSVSMGDFRVKLDLKSMKYFDFAFGVR